MDACDERVLRAITFEREAHAVRTAELEAEVAALRKDAERYRYVREHIEEWYPNPTPEEFDADIDAALKD
jgi:hypothetical protein